LIAADVATYSSLKNFLYERVDQSLDTAQQPLGRPGFGDGPGGRGQQVEHFAPGTFVELRDTDDSVAFVAPARARGGNEYTPDLEDHITLPASTGADEAHKYF